MLWSEGQWPETQPRARLDRTFCSRGPSSGWRLIPHSSNKEFLNNRALLHKERRLALRDKSVYHQEVERHLLPSASSTGKRPQISKESPLNHRPKRTKPSSRASYQSHNGLKKAAEPAPYTSISLVQKNTDREDSLVCAKIMRKDWIRQFSRLMKAQRRSSSKHRLWLMECTARWQSWAVGSNWHQS